MDNFGQNLEQIFNDAIDRVLTMAINIILGQIVKTLTVILAIIVIIIALHILEDFRRKRCINNLTLPSILREMNHINRWKHFSRKNPRYTKMFYNALLNVKASENPEEYRLSKKILEEIEESKNNFDKLFGLVLLSTNESLWFEKIE